jgi:hypothetical protein
MNEVVAFSRYIGVVVVVCALVLVAPRATVGAWAALVRWTHGRWHAVRTWRPGTVVATEQLVPVEISVGDRRGADPGEVMHHQGLPRAWAAVRELAALTRDVLQGRALLLAVAGLTLRATSELVAQLPRAAVLTGDLLLVLGAFLVMQRTISTYPEEMLPALRNAFLPLRVTGRRSEVPRGIRLRSLLQLAVLAPAFLLLLAWPGEIGRFVAEKQFTGPGTTVITVWACELPWLVAVAWFLARPLLRPLRPTHAAKHAAAPVVRLRSSAPASRERSAA